MDTFDSKITIVLCGAFRNTWTIKFAEFFGTGMQATQGDDFWQGKDEPVIRITHWFNYSERKWTTSGLRVRLSDYQRVCEQDAIAIELTIQGEWNAHVTYNYEDLLRVTRLLLPGRIIPHVD